MYLKTKIEIAIANYFDFRQKIIVPNVSYGLNVHECDILIMTKAGYAYEVEIKISKGDLKADLKKKHQHINKRIKGLWFCIPKKLESSINYIPVRAGILIYNVGYIKEIRKPIIQQATPFTDGDITHLLHLGCMRIWGLKKKIIKLKEEYVQKFC